MGHVSLVDLKLHKEEEKKKKERKEEGRKEKGKKGEIF